MFRVVAVLAFAVLLPALPAHARLLDDQHAHDGFFLRFNLGVGHFDAEWHGGLADSMSIAGPSGHFGLALGGAIAPNLILFGELSSDAASNPTFRYGPFEGDLGSDLGLVGFGPGIAYYFMPVNLYLSGTALLLRATTTGDEGRIETDRGFGVKLALGKEWWVSRDWGLGVAGIATLGSIPSDDSTVKVSNFSLAFTATYN